MSANDPQSTPPSHSEKLETLGGAVTNWRQQSQGEQRAIDRRQRERAYSPEIYAAVKTSVQGLFDGLVAAKVALAGNRTSRTHMEAERQGVAALEQGVNVAVTALGLAAPETYRIEAKVKDQLLSDLESNVDTVVRSQQESLASESGRPGGNGGATGLLR